MEIIKKNLTIPYFDYYLFNEYFKGMRYCTFDIETMGLEPRRAPMILAGFMEVDQDGQAELKQFFLDKPEEEHILLNEVIAELNKYDLVITYNGSRFDLPYVIKRYNMIHHEDPDIRPFDLDLYRVVKKHSTLGDILPSLSQKRVEEYMGLSPSRTDMISGAESVQLYYHYITEADKELREAIKETILLHNSDDVEQLYKLLPILKECDLHCALQKLGFPVLSNKIAEADIFKIAKSGITRNTLSISGTYQGKPFSYKGFSSIGTPYELEFSTNGAFSVSLPVNKNSNAYYVNLLDYFHDTEDFRLLPCYVNDYLILKEGKEIHSEELNLFIKKLLNNIKLV